jgi:hypothetical protein
VLNYSAERACLDLSEANGYSHYIAHVNCDGPCDRYFERCRTFNTSSLLTSFFGCLGNPQDFGIDSGSQNQPFTIYGGRAAVGYTTCGTATPIPTTGPIALHLPGGTISEYTAVQGYRFPVGGFTVEGFVNVQRGSGDRTVGSGDRYWFSYASPDNSNSNCLLVSSNMTNFDVWQHWAMTVAAAPSYAIQHYINGVPNNSPRYSTHWCGAQGGSLVLGQDQDGPLGTTAGRFDPNQAPNMMIDSIRVHAAVLTQAQIQAISTGGSPGTTLWDSWCFSNPNMWGYDAGTQRADFVVYGGRPAVGFSSCGTDVGAPWWTSGPTPPPTAPLPTPAGSSGSGSGSSAAVVVVIIVLVVLVVGGVLYKTKGRWCRMGTSRTKGYRDVNNPAFGNNVAVNGDDDDDNDNNDKDEDDDEMMTIDTDA